MTEAGTVTQADVTTEDGVATTGLRVGPMPFNTVRRPMEAARQGLIGS